MRIQLKISGLDFDDSDDSNAKDIWQNEDPDILDEFDDGLYGIQDEDEELGKIKASNYQVMKILEIKLKFQDQIWLKSMTLMPKTFGKMKIQTN